MIFGASIGLARLALCVLGVMVITSEYSSGTIRASVLAVPHRLPVLAAKAVVFAAIDFVVSAIVVFATFFITTAILRPHGTPSRGEPAAAAGSVQPPEPDQDVPEHVRIRRPPSLARALQVAPGPAVRFRRRLGPRPARQRGAIAAYLRDPRAALLSQRGRLLRYPSRRILMSRVQLNSHPSPCAAKSPAAPRFPPAPEHAPDAEASIREGTGGGV